MTKENIKEQVMGSMPVKTAGSGNVRGSGVKTKLNPGKVTPQSQIRKIDPKQFDNRSAAVTTNTPSGGSLKAGSFGISQAGRQQAAANRAEFKAKVDAVKSSENKPVVSSTTKQGKPRTKAQMMAAKRIASGKTIADVKKSNTDAMRARAAKRFADFKAKREAKRLERMKKGTKMSHKDPDAYRDFETDFRDGVRIKTKPSRYTKQWEKYFPNAKSLRQKSRKTGVPLDILEKVNEKGMAAWRTGHRPGANIHQWGYARVHSFLVKGKTFYTTDRKLALRAMKNKKAKKWLF